eukprot:9489427-Pyramimonas_sp.AAC.1
MFNAFGSTQWDQLDETVLLHSCECDHALCQQRYKNTVISLEALGGPLTVRPTQRNTMGGPFAVRAFVGTFARPTFSWRHGASQADLQPKRLRASWQGLQADLSTYKFADDINCYVLADPNMPLRDFTRKVTAVDARLDSYVTEFGHGQN